MTGLIMLKDYADKKEFMRPLNSMERDDLRKALGQQSAFKSEDPYLIIARNLNLLLRQKNVNA